MICLEMLMSAVINAPTLVIQLFIPLGGFRTLSWFCLLGGPLVQSKALSQPLMLSWRTFLVSTWTSIRAPWTLYDSRGKHFLDFDKSVAPKAPAKSRTLRNCSEQLSTLRRSHNPRSEIRSSDPFPPDPSILSATMPAAYFSHP